MSSNDTIIDMTHIIDLLDKMKTDANDNGINMLNVNDIHVNNYNMINYFYQFIKKYVNIVNKSNDITSI
jgi:hypothetical protein